MFYIDGLNASIEESRIEINRTNSPDVKWWYEQRIDACKAKISRYLSSDYTGGLL